MQLMLCLISFVWGQSSCQEHGTSENYKMEKSCLQCHGNVFFSIKKVIYFTAAIALNVYRQRKPKQDRKTGGNANICIHLYAETRCGLYLQDIFSRFNRIWSIPNLWGQDVGGARCMGIAGMQKQAWLKIVYLVFHYLSSQQGLSHVS